MLQSCWQLPTCVWLWGHEHTWLTEVTENHHQIHCDSIILVFVCGYTYKGTYFNTVIYISMCVSFHDHAEADQLWHIKKVEYKCTYPGVNMILEKCRIAVTLLLHSHFLRIHAIRVHSKFEEKNREAVVAQTLPYNVNHCEHLC